MLQAGGQLGFAFETLEQLLVERPERAHYLQGHQPIQAGLPGLVDRPHAPTADLFEDLVARNLRQARVPRLPRCAAGGGRGIGGRRALRRLRLDENDDFYGSPDPALLFLAPSDGSYYFGVSSTGNDSYDPFSPGGAAGTTTGPYRLRLLVDDNDTLFGATPLNLVQGLVAYLPGTISPSDVDMFAIDLSEGHRLRCYEREAPGVLRVFDSSGDEVTILPTLGPDAPNGATGDSLTLYAPEGTLRARLAVEPLSDRLASADLNGDSYEDLVAANTFSGNVHLFFGDAHGGLSEPRSMEATPGLADLAVFDADCSGSADLVLTNRRSGQVELLLGRGDGTFTREAFYASSGLYGVEQRNPFATLTPAGKGPKVDTTAPSLMVCSQESLSGLAHGGDGTVSLLLGSDRGLPLGQTYLAPGAMHPAALAMAEGGPLGGINLWIIDDTETIAAMRLDPAQTWSAAAYQDATWTAGGLWVLHEGEEIVPSFLLAAGGDEGSRAAGPSLAAGLGAVAMVAWSGLLTLPTRGGNGARR